MKKVLILEDEVNIRFRVSSGDQEVELFPAASCLEELQFMALELESKVQP